MMDEEIQECLKFQTRWDQELMALRQLTSEPAPSAEGSEVSFHRLEEQCIRFSEEDMEALLAFPLKECASERFFLAPTLFTSGFHARSYSRRASATINAR